MGYFWVADLDEQDEQEYPAHSVPEPAETREEANLVGSRLPNGRHVIQLDLDWDHFYEPSSTRGHGHLTIVPKIKDVDGVTWEKYQKLLELLGELGVLQSGYVNMAKKNSQSFLRLSEVKKGQSHKVAARRAELHATGATELLEAFAELLAL